MELEMNLADPAKPVWSLNPVYPLLSSKQQGIEAVTCQQKQNKDHFFMM